jgi:hypothetical protein
VSASASPGNSAAPWSRVRLQSLTLFSVYVALVLGHMSRQTRAIYPSNGIGEQQQPLAKARHCRMHRVSLHYN